MFSVWKKISTFSLDFQCHNLIFTPQIWKLLCDAWFDHCSEVTQQATRLHTCFVNIMVVSGGLPLLCLITHQCEMWLCLCLVDVASLSVCQLVVKINCIILSLLQLLVRSETHMTFYCSMFFCDCTYNNTYNLSLSLIGIGGCWSAFGKWAVTVQW